MVIETITENPDLVVRKMTLLPGEKTIWHSDSCRRLSVVVSGSRLGIEYRASGQITEFELTTGSVDWDDPQPEVHRAINLGDHSYIEVVTFFRDNETVDPQPEPTDAVP